MKFYFPDSQDQIDPSYDMTSEQNGLGRIRQRDDHYAHEALATVPYDGLLVSKTVVDGLPGAAGKYTTAQRERLYREGVRRFFRLDQPKSPRIATLGDCGAFTYHRDESPPYTPDDVIDFYEEAGFDAGLSVDHVILGYCGDADPPEDSATAWESRQQMTLDLAATFKQRCKERRVAFQPLGVAQGWSPNSYAHSVAELQKMGFDRIALGGMVPLKTRDVLACLDRIDDVRKKQTSLHLLGVTRLDSLSEFAARGVTSFDSTSPFRQAFMDERDNYYTARRTYTAVRIPQVDGNPRLKARIRAGQINQREAIHHERAAITAVRDHDRKPSTRALKQALSALADYQQIHDPDKDYSLAYEETLTDRAWQSCACGVCDRVGVDVVIFRGTERNKRRGFHNLHVFGESLDQHRGPEPQT